MSIPLDITSVDSITPFEEEANLAIWIKLMKNANKFDKPGQISVWVNSFREQPEEVALWAHASESGKKRILIKNIDRLVFIRSKHNLLFLSLPKLSFLS